jgi:F5/8 type C domain
MRLPGGLGPRVGRPWAVIPVVIVYGALAVGVATWCFRHTESYFASPRAPSGPSAARPSTLPPGSSARPPSPTGPSPTATVAMPPRPGQPAGSPPVAGSQSSPPAGPAPATEALTEAEAGVAALAPVAPPSKDLALNSDVLASTHAAGLKAWRATDGDVWTYWQADKGFPQTLRVDLGAVDTVGRVRLALPPDPRSGRQTQTVAILGGRSQETPKTLSDPVQLTFNPTGAMHGTAVITFKPATVRYITVKFVSSGGSLPARLSELRVFSS